MPPNGGPLVDHLPAGGCFASGWRFSPRGRVRPAVQMCGGPTGKLLLLRPVYEWSVYKLTVKKLHGEGLFHQCFIVLALFPFNFPHLPSFFPPSHPLPTYVPCAATGE